MKLLFHAVRFGFINMWIRRFNQFMLKFIGVEICE